MSDNLTAADLHELSTEYQKGVTALREYTERQEAEQQKIGATMSETKSAIEKIGARLDEIETRVQRARVQPADEAKQAQTEFAQFLKTGITPEGTKLMSVGSDPDGGYLVPEMMSNQWLMEVRERSPIRQLASVFTISSGDTLTFPSDKGSDFGCEWTSECAPGCRPLTDTAQVGQVKIPVHEKYARIEITNKLLEDAAVNLESWASMRIADLFARKENAAFVNGDGVNKPTGFLNGGAPVCLSGDADQLTADAIVGLPYQLKAEYRSRGTFLANRQTIRVIRQLKDGQGNYLWAPASIVSGEPATLVGFPILEAPDLVEPTDKTSDLYTLGDQPLWFGDWMAAYYIIDRRGISVIRDAITCPGRTKLYFSRRVGGALVCAEAIVGLEIGV